MTSIEHCHSRCNREKHKKPDDILIINKDTTKKTTKQDMVAC